MKQTHSVKLVKNTKNRVRSDKIQTQIDKVITRVHGGNRLARGWKCETIKSINPIVANGGYQYLVDFKINYNSAKERKPEIVKKEFEDISNIIGKTAGIHSWEILTIDGVEISEETKAKTSGFREYYTVEIPTQWKKFFLPIYKRDNQIDLIMSSLKAAIYSDFKNRFHVALIGPPASGKTETCHCLKTMLSEDAVLEYDATATTQAGAIKDLNDRETLPRILMVEEIEKTEPNSLRYLLSIMDHRAEIRKVNFRDNIQKETKLWTIATVNNYELFNTIMDGALASRFAHHICYPVPDRDLLKQILEREVLKIKGSRNWIEPTLDFAMEFKIFDPRKVTAICLCGQNDLLNGSYQKKLKACSMKNSFK